MKSAKKKRKNNNTQSAHKKLIDRSNWCMNIISHGIEGHSFLYLYTLALQIILRIETIIVVSLQKVFIVFYDKK